MRREPHLPTPIARRLKATSSLISDPLALQKLGLGPQDIQVSKQVIRQTTVRGDEVVEVAEPVTAEDGEFLGTVRYGLSTQRMRESMSAARTESSARLRNSLLLIASLVSATTLLAFAVSRMQAVRITRPIGDLTEAANSFAAGNRDVRVRIESGDELEILGSSFNRMVEELNGSYRELEQMNRTLERRVEERTSELARKNRDMRLVLDTVDQGFLTLSPLGIMARERSRVMDEWFGAHPGEMPFVDYIAATSRSFADGFQCAWDQIADDILPFEVCIEQLPSRLRHGKRTFSFRYLPYFRDGQLEGILVVIADITARLQHDREEAEQGELMQTLRSSCVTGMGSSASNARRPS